MTIKFIIPILLTVVLCFYIFAPECKLKDAEAVQLSKKFCKLVNASVDSEPWVLSSKKGSINSTDEVKEVVVGPRGTFKLSIDIGCKDKQIKMFQNIGVRDYVFLKYHISRDNRKARQWPQALSENKAKELLFQKANLIGLPPDVKFKSIILDKQYNGVWIATWVRTLNSFPYENDFVSISIMAIDGELFSYNRFFSGEPCPTKVKVSENAAKEIAKRKIQSILSQKNALNYIVASTDLKIVQPNAFLGIFTPFSRHKSRLAWVFRFNRYIGANNIAEGNLPDFIIIKVDAATGKVIGGKSAK